MPFHLCDFNYCFYDTNITGVIYIAETKDKDPVYAYDINKDIVYKTNKTHNLYTESNVSYLNAYLYGVELLKSVKSTGKMILVSEKIDVLKLNNFDRFGGIVPIVKLFGGKENYKNMIKELENLIYCKECA